jgi:hypothetical protein
MVIGNAHLGESEALRTEAIAAVRAQLPAAVPTMIQGADTLHDVSNLVHTSVFQLKSCGMCVAQYGLISQSLLAFIHSLLTIIFLSFPINSY